MLFLTFKNCLRPASVIGNKYIFSQISEVVPEKVWSVEYSTEVFFNFDPQADVVLIRPFSFNSERGKSLEYTRQLIPTADTIVSLDSRFAV